MTGDSAKSGNQRLTKKPENWEFITDKTIARLLKGPPANRIIWDEGSGSYKGKLVYAARGFGARQTEAGTISYVLNYHIDGKERRFTIGRHPEYTPITAREEAKKLLVRIEDEKENYDPLEERQVLKEEPTFAELAADWLVHAKNVKNKRESSLYNDRKMLGLNEDGSLIEDKDPAMRKRRILFVFGERKLSRITQREIAVFRTMLRDTPVRPNRKTAPYAANRVLVLIKTIFNFALRDPTYKGWIEENPAQGIKLFAEEVHESCISKDASKDEMTPFLAALDKYPDQNAADCLRLMLLTGCRVSEALTAEWKDFDLNSGVWTKWSHKTKTKTTVNLQLGDDEVELLRSMKPKNAVGPLFPGTKRKGKGGKPTGSEMRESLRRPWLQVCKMAGLVKVDQVEGKRKNKDGSPKMLTRYRPTVRLHDLRHTNASLSIQNGESLYAVGKRLDHVNPMTTNRYIKWSPEAGRATANKYAKIIEFKKRRA